MRQPIIQSVIYFEAEGNVIKVLSLTLGLGVGLILFARVAFELSFDTFLTKWKICIACMCDTMMIKRERKMSLVSYLPRSRRLCGKSSRDTVRDGLQEKVRAVLYHGEDRFKPRLMMADFSFSVRWESRC